MLINCGPRGEGRQLGWVHNVDYGHGEDLGITVEGVNIVDPADEARLRGVGVLDDKRTGADREVLFVLYCEVEHGRNFGGRRLEILMGLLNIVLGETLRAEERS